MRYRIVRRWTTKTNKVTSKIVEISEDQFYIQYRNIFSILFYGVWKDLNLFGFNSFEEALDDLDRRLNKKSIKTVEHQKVEMEI